MDRISSLQEPTPSLLLADLQIGTNNNRGSPATEGPPVPTMISVIFLSALIGYSLGTPLTAVWLSPIAPVAPLPHYQTQDGLGGYHYSYTTPHHTKVETGLDGITQGGYSYIDANGILQTVAYSADALKGFRLPASNLPQSPKDELTPVKDSPEVVAAKEVQLDELRSTEQRDQVAENWQSSPSSGAVGTETDNKLESEKSGIRKVENPYLLERRDEADKIVGYLPNTRVSQPLAYQPDGQRLRDQFGQIQTLQHLPIVQPYLVPFVPYRLTHSSMRHTQDSLGQYDYTYHGDTSAKTESRSLDGTTRGAYSYVDPNGLLQQVHYIADHNGFRVAATNLPEAK